MSALEFEGKDRASSVSRIFIQKKKGYQKQLFVSSNLN